METVKGGRNGKAFVVSHLFPCHQEVKLPLDILSTKPLAVGYTEVPLRGEVTNATGLLPHMRRAFCEDWTLPPSLQPTKIRPQNPPPPQPPLFLLPPSFLVALWLLRRRRRRCGPQPTDDEGDEERSNKHGFVHRPISMGNPCSQEVEEESFRFLSRSLQSISTTRKIFPRAHDDPRAHE